MSTIDDLRNELAQRAGEATRSHHTDRMAGIRRKRTAQRRGMAAGVAGGTALAVAAVVALMPGSATVTDPAPPPPATKPTQDRTAPALPGAPIPTVGEGGVEFYTTPGLAALNAYEVGEPGQRRIEFSFVPDSDVITYTHVCYGVPGIVDRRDNYSIVSITINGFPQSSVSCSGENPGFPESPSVGWSGDYDREVRSWKDYGVQAGATVDVVVELEQARGGSASDPDVVLGAGFWSVPEPQPGDLHEVNDNTVLPDVTEHLGVNYRYVTSVSAVRGPGEPLAAPQHRSGTPVLVRWGTNSGGEFDFDPGNPGVPSSGRSDSAISGAGDLVRSGDTSETTLTGRRLKRDRAELWIALYEPIQ